MVVVEYVFLCQGCHHASYKEEPGSIGFKPAAPEVPPLWSHENGVLLCPSCTAGTLPAPGEARGQAPKVYH